MTNETRTFSELIEDLNETLAEMDGEGLEEIYNNIMSSSCEYQGNGTFNVKHD